MDPAAHTGDGNQDIILVSFFTTDFHSLSKDDDQVHKTSYLGFLRYLVRSAYQRSHPFTLPYVRAVRVKQWEFIPDGVSASIMNYFL